MKEMNQCGQVLDFAVRNWQPVLKPSISIMHGMYCSLEHMDIDKHASQLFHALSLDNEQGASWTYLPYGPFDTYQAFREWLRESTSANDTLLYAILDNKTQLPIGICGYLRINEEHGSIEVGHLHFSTLLKKTPAATEAMYLMMKRAFDECEYRRYEWKCNDLNQPSHMAAQRLGFKFEGVFRQHFVFKGRNRNTAWYSILDSEWPEIRKRLEKWLDPNNFDRHGNQILKLKDCG